MPAEVELKFKVTGFEEIRKALRKAGGRMVHESARERNLVLDTPDGRICGEGRLLRIREYGGSVFVTVKEPVEPGPMKSRIENEIEIEKTFDEARVLFGRIECRPVYSYEKNREIWILNESHICLDELHFGLFVEIESQSRSGVSAAAALLGLPVSRGIKRSYRFLEKESEYSNS